MALENETPENSDENEALQVAQTGDDNTEEFAAELVAEMPEPNPDFPKPETEAKPEAKPGAILDSENTPLDPSLHVTDKDGNGVKTSKGKWRLKPGRKGGASPTRPSIVNGTGQESQHKETPEIQAQNYAVTGAVLASCFVNTCVAVGGPDFMPVEKTPEGLNEREFLHQSFTEFAKAKQMEDLPPGWALLGAMALYITPRLYMPKTQSRFERLWNGAKAWWFKRKAAKQPYKAPEDKGQE